MYTIVYGCQVLLSTVHYCNAVRCGECEMLTMYGDELFSVVPHITDAIQNWVERVAKVPVDGDNKQPDCCIIEVRECTTTQFNIHEIKYFYFHQIWRICLD